MTAESPTEQDVPDDGGVSLKKYQRFAELLDDLKKARLELWDELEGDLPEEVYETQIWQIARYEKSLRADLEKEMMDSHPGKWRADLFMGKGVDFGDLNQPVQTND